MIFDKVLEDLCASKCTVLLIAIIRVLVCVINFSFYNKRTGTWCTCSRSRKQARTRVDER